MDSISSLGRKTGKTDTGKQDPIEVKKAGDLERAKAAIAELASIGIGVTGFRMTEERLSALEL
jgi:hypothetical protein